MPSFLRRNETAINFAAALSLAVGSCLGTAQWLHTLRTPRPPHPTLEGARGRCRQGVDGGRGGR